MLHALWVEEKNTGDPATLKAIVAGCGLDADAVMKAGETPEAAVKRDEYTKAAIESGVFGAPFFIIDGERFWGQDRIDFVERKLASRSKRHAWDFELSGQLLPCSPSASFLAAW